MELSETAVVILSFNHPQLTENCVKSVLAGNSGRDFHKVVLVHNGSGKGTVNQLQRTFPRIQHVVLNENRGFSGGANFGIATALSAGAKQVLFLTNDTEVRSIQNLHFRLLSGRSNTEFIAAPKIFVRTRQVIDSVGGHADLFKGALRHHKIDSPKPANFYVPGTAFLVTASAWTKIPGFDESLGTYWEDVDLSFRAAQIGIGLGILEGIEISHKIGRTCHKDPKYSVYYFQRNRKRIAWKHGSLANRFVFAHFYAFDSARKLVRYLKSGDRVRCTYLLKAVIG